MTPTGFSQRELLKAGIEGSGHRIDCKVGLSVSCLVTVW